jgi:hypothetical protein
MKILSLVKIYLSINLISILYCLFLREKLMHNGIEIGWPYLYYERFRLNGSLSDNHGWNFNNFFIDQFIILGISIVILFFYKWLSHKSHKENTAPLANTVFKKDTTQKLH